MESLGLLQRRLAAELAEVEDALTHATAPDWEGDAAHGYATKWSLNLFDVRRLAADVVLLRSHLDRLDHLVVLGATPGIGSLLWR